MGRYSIREKQATHTVSLINHPTYITTMKKLAYLAAALVCCPLVLAQDAAAPAAPAATAVSSDEAEAAVDSVIAAMNELLATLETIKDKASADAAAVKLEDIKARVLASQDSLDKISSMDEESQQKIAMKLLPAVFMLAPRMEKVTAALEENDFYGSEALKAVMEEDDEEELGEE